MDKKHPLPWAVPTRDERDLILAEEIIRFAQNPRQGTSRSTQRVQVTPDSTIDSQDVKWHTPKEVPSATSASAQQSNCNHLVSVREDNEVAASTSEGPPPVPVPAEVGTSGSGPLESANCLLAEASTSNFNEASIPVGAGVPLHYLLNSRPVRFPVLRSNLIPVTNSILAAIDRCNETHRLERRNLVEGSDTDTFPDSLAPFSQPSSQSNDELPDASITTRREEPFGQPPSSQSNDELPDASQATRREEVFGQAPSSQSNDEFPDGSQITRREEPFSQPPSSQSNDVLPNTSHTTRREENMQAPQNEQDAIIADINPNYDPDEAGDDDYETDDIESEDEPEDGEEVGSQNVVEPGPSENPEVHYESALSKWSKSEKLRLIKVIIDISREIKTRQLQRKRSRLVKKGRLLVRAIEEKILDIDHEITAVNQQTLRELALPLNKLEDYNWEKVARVLNSNRTPQECYKFWKLFLHPNINKSAWGADEIKAMQIIARRHNFRNWDLIAQELGTNRSGHQCYMAYRQHRCPHSDLHDKRTKN